MILYLKPENDCLRDYSSFKLESRFRSWVARNRSFDCRLRRILGSRLELAENRSPSLARGKRTAAQRRVRRFGRGESEADDDARI